VNEKAAQRGPTFARGFPAEPRLDALVRAFADGDYARVRREAPELVKSGETEDVRRAAAVLLERTKADPLMVLLLGLAALLLVVLSAYWIVHRGGLPA
jgi:hypothetical protein